MKVFIPESVVKRARKDGVEMSRDLVTIVKPDPRLAIPMPAGADFAEWLDAETAKIGHECTDWTLEDEDEHGTPTEWCPGCIFRSEMQWRWNTRQLLLHPPPQRHQPSRQEIATQKARMQADLMESLSKWLKGLNPVEKVIFETGDKKERRLLYRMGFLKEELSWSDMLDYLEPDWEATIMAVGAQRLAEDAEKVRQDAEKARLRAEEEEKNRPAGHPLFGTASPHEWIHTARNKDVDELVADFNAWQSTPKNRRPIWCGVGQRTLPGVGTGGSGNVSMRVSNVSDRIRLWDVREFCAAAGGRVRDVFHPAPGGTKKPFLFVEFLTEDECERAVATLSAAPVILYGRELKFEVSVNTGAARTAPAQTRATPAPAPAPTPAPARAAPAPVQRRTGGFAALAPESESDSE